MITDGQIQAPVTHAAMTVSYSFSLVVSTVSVPAMNTTNTTQVTPVSQISDGQASSFGHEHESWLTFPRFKLPLLLPQLQSSRLRMGKHVSPIRNCERLLTQEQIQASTAAAPKSAVPVSQIGDGQASHLSGN